MLAECRHAPLVFGPGFCVLAFYIQQGRLCTVGADLGHELIRDKLVKGLGSEVMESVMLHSSFEGALALQKVGSCGSPCLSWTLASYGFGPGVAILILRTEHLKHNVLFMTPDICSRSLIQQGRKFG